MPYLIISENMKQPPYWSVPWGIQNHNGSWFQVGGWERDLSRATKYADPNEAEAVIAFRQLDAKVLHING